jgi:hypothetical protein
VTDPSAEGQPDPDATSDELYPDDLVTVEVVVRVQDLARLYETLADLWRGPPKTGRIRVG